jgi:DHA2 family multidrug resistance protein
MADASGLYNLARQVGGSAGIAILSTFLDHRTAMHRSALVENINMYSTAALQRLSLLQNMFMSKGFPLPVARQQALSIIDKTVQGQAAILGFEDVFLASALVFVAAIPLLLLFKKGKSIPGHKASSAE